MAVAAPVRDTFELESAGREAWARRFFGTIDAMDSPGFAAFFTEGGSFRMGNTPAFVGRQAIKEFVRGFFAGLQGLRHNITGLWEAPTAFFSEGIVTYMTQDGQEVSLPYLGVMEFEGELIRDYRAYLDPAPLIAALYPAQS